MLVPFSALGGDVYALLVKGYDLVGKIDEICTPPMEFNLLHGIPIFSLEAAGTAHLYEEEGCACRGHLMTDN